MIFYYLKEIKIFNIFDFKASIQQLRIPNTKSAILMVWGYLTCAYSCVAEVIIRLSQNFKTRL